MTWVRNDTVPVDCARCGAGYLLSPQHRGYTCTSCGNNVVFSRCPGCQQVGIVGQGHQYLQCSGCGKNSSLRNTGEASARDLLPNSACFRPGATPDPQQRAVFGIVTAASSVPALVPGSPCLLLFSWDYIGVHAGHGELDRIAYSDVNFLDVSGQGTKTHTSNAGIIGGGFGLEGALKGMALAYLVNAATTRAATVHDTVVSLRAAQRAVMMRNETFEPDELRIILSPAYYRIEQAARARQLPKQGQAAPAGWYPDPTGASGQRYWDGKSWTSHMGP